MANVTRRGFVSTMGLGAAALAVSPLLAWQARAATGGLPAFGRGFGALEPTLPLNSAELPANLQGQPLLALPKGFDYTVISATGQTLSDGRPVPGNHDGMATFQVPGTSNIVVVRNHELTTSSRPVVVQGGQPYDATQAGGTTTLVLDNQGKLISHVGSLAGTTRNCSGGATPWGSWLSCEESFSMGTKKHGYVFEVPYNDVVRDPQPLIAMGRFNHEGCAVDPRTGYIYMTEDAGRSGFFRFIPNSAGYLPAGGSLWALRLKDFPSVNTATGFKSLLNQPLAADWVRITEPDPVADTVRIEARNAGAAGFSSGEGIFFGNGLVYFVCSSGGDAGEGQVFAYDPVASTLTLVFEAVPASELGYTDPSFTAESVAANDGFVGAAPDNITVGPDGRIYLCEDGSGIQKLVGLNHDGDVFEVIRNELNDSEFAGACFTHDGRFMIMNVQSPGFTCVIRGNWRQGQR